MIKTVFIHATFKPILKDVFENIPTGETKKNWFGIENKITKKVSTKKIVGYSDSEIDGEKLSNDINLEIEKYSENNCKVLSITPISSGRYNYQYSSKEITSSQRIIGDTEKVRGGGSYGFGYGYSFTEGVLLCLELDDSTF